MTNIANQSSFLCHQICTANSVKILSAIIHLPVFELGFLLHFPRLTLLDEAFHILFHFVAKLPLMKSSLPKVELLRSIFKKAS